MKISHIKRYFALPLVHKKRILHLHNSCMTPTEILAEEKKCHDAYLVHDKTNRKDLANEFMHKRDVLRKVLRIYG